MKTPYKIILTSISAILILFVALVLYVLFGDLSVHRDRILAAASDATGFAISGDGAFDLSIGRQVSLSAEQLTVSNPEWPDAEPLAVLGRFGIVVDTWSLISGPLGIHSIDIADTNLSLQEPGDGSANWVVSSDQPEETGVETTAPLLHVVNLADVRVSYAGGDASVTGSISMTARPDFGGDFGNIRLDFDDTTLNLVHPVAVEAAVDGFVVVDLSGSVPSLRADIDASSLVVEEPAESDDEPGQQPSDDELLFGTQPLADSWLRSLQLEADVSIEQAVIGGDEFADIHIAAALADGSFEVTPLELSLGDGSVTGSLALLARDDQYEMQVSAEAQGLRLAQFAGEGQDPATLPPLNMSLQLAGSGASLHDIMSASNGRIGGRQGSGELDLQAANALLSDMLTSLLRSLNPLAEAEPLTKVECAVFDIDIADGVAGVEQLAMQTDRLTIVGSGEVDFETETLDLTVQSKPREGLGISVGGVADSFVKLGGTLKEPSLGVDAAGTVSTTGAAVATGGLSLLAKSLWDRVTAEVSICEEAAPDD